MLRRAYVRITGICVPAKSHARPNNARPGSSQFTGIGDRFTVAQDDELFRGRGHLYLQPVGTQAA